MRASARPLFSSRQARLTVSCYAVATMKTRCLPALLLLLSACGGPAFEAGEVSPPAPAPDAAPLSEAGALLPEGSPSTPSPTQPFSFDGGTASSSDALPAPTMADGSLDPGESSLDAQASPPGVDSPDSPDAADAADAPHAADAAPVCAPSECPASCAGFSCSGCVGMTPGECPAGLPFPGHAGVDCCSSPGL